MHSPARALTWQLWGRHRWGMGGLGLGLAALAGLYQAFPLAATETGVALLVIPLALVFVYLAYVFSYEEIGQRARPSGFPAWMFTLPVRTWVLVAWPVFFGAATVGLTWAGVAALVLRPAGLEVPAAWPALALAASLVWLQAVDWAPLGAPAKVAAAGAALAGVWGGLLSERFHEVVVWLLPVFVLLGYAAAVVGVARARQGGLSARPAWRWPALAAPRLPARERQPFTSTARAQFWLEWRRNGSLLPCVFGCWLLLSTLLIYYSSPEGSVSLIHFNALNFLPFLAPLLGCALGKADVWSRQLRLPAYAAARPATEGELVVAKLRMAAVSLLAAWLLAACAIPAWVAYLGNRELVLERFDVQLRQFPGLEPWAVALLGAVGLFGFAWFQIAGNLFAGLCGRGWAFYGLLLFYLAGVPNLLVLQSGLHAEHPDLYALYREALPWLASAAVLAKFAAAAWASHRAVRRGMVRARAVAWVVALWSLVAACLFTLAYASLRTQEVSPYRVFLGVALALPLLRVAAAPWALAWNRHR